MWYPSEIQNQTMRNLFNRCRNRMRISMYRTRNPIEVSDILYPLSFLFAPGGRTVEERDKYIGFRTIATPRNTATEEGVAFMLGELAEMQYPLNIIVINTINNKEVGDALYEYLKQDASQATALESYTTVLTQSPYHRTQLMYEELDNGDEGKIKNYYLFTNKMNDIAIGRLAGCICAHMDLFGENTGNIATALIQGKQDLYETLITAFIEEASTSEHLEQMRRDLEQVGAYGTRRMEERIRNDIRSKQNTIDDYLRVLNSMYNELREEQIRLIGIQHQGNNANELTEFLLGNINNVTFARLYDGYLYMRYRTPLLYWDADVFKILREATNRNPMHPANDAKQQLIDDIFDTGKVTLWFDSGFRYNLVNNGIQHIKIENNFNDVPTAKGLPNPHHYYFDCWGDNASMIAQAQSRGDNVVALAQVFAAIAGLNLSDSVVTNKFVNEMFDTHRNIKCLEIKETNEFISIEEYFRRYHEAQQIARTTTPTQAQPEFPFE